MSDAFGLETVRTSIGFCHKIGPMPKTHPTKKDSYACVYLDYGDPNDLIEVARLFAASPRLLHAAERLLTWDRKNPKGRIYPDHEGKDVETELDVIVAEIKEAVRAVREGA